MIPSNADKHKKQQISIKIANKHKKERVWLKIGLEHKEL
jgi:hypothetical protein